jgi:hypothetical protein
MLYGVNAIWYYSEGDNLNAGIISIAMLPVIGNLTMGGKYSFKIAKRLGGETALKWSRDAVTRIIKFGRRTQLRDVIGITSRGFEAHHIIPWNLGTHSIVQNAAKVGFHMNQALNGVALLQFLAATGEGVHSSHKAYNDWVEAWLNRAARANPNMPGAQARDLLENELIPELQGLIDEAIESGDSLNNYFKTID